MSATTPASTRLSVRRALPVSSAINRASSSLCSFSSAAHRPTSAPRLRAGILAHFFCARSAVFDRGHHVGRIALGRLTDYLARGRIDDVERLAGLARHQPAIDEM